MAYIATWSQELAGEHVERSLLGDRHESVAWVMSMTILDVACNAEIVVFTHGACDEVRFIKFYHC